MSNLTIILLLCGLIVLSYLFGNISNAVILSKFKKQDIRTMGSGNPGTLNMSRNFGFKFGLLTLFLDLLKGMLPTLIGFLVFRKTYFEGAEFLVADIAKYALGLSVVLGHIYPVFYKFKGGKGIASTIGVFLACEPLLALLAIVFVFLFIFFFEYGSLGSLIGVTFLAVASVVTLYNKYESILSFVSKYLLIANLLLVAICFFTWFAHRKNILSLLSADEHKTSIKAMIKRAKEKKANKIKTEQK